MAQLSPEGQAEAERLFARALELSPEERMQFLERECAQVDVRLEAASLLEHAGDGLTNFDEVIASAAADLASEVNPDERLVGTRLGPYRLISIAGHGGMGAVYRAMRDDGEFEQQVAIKLVRAAAESASAQHKFRQERQIMARLSHPNIARLLDGGSTHEGVPYLVMEFIEGEPITTWCISRALSVEERLRIFLMVCEGVEAANHDLVIHRDLKPSNILVTRDGSPKLLDFGIAKLLEPDIRDGTLTDTQFRAMTPDYAAPEQVRGEAVTAATDVYALGLVLYEVLTGVKAQRITNFTPGTMARFISEVEPVAPAVINPHLPRDLDNIIRMAIRKEPERRYASAAELGEDIRRYLTGRPVLARADTLAYRSAKFLRRHRVGFTAGAISVVVAICGFALFYWLEGAPQPRGLQIAQLTQSAHVDVTNRIVTDGSMLYFTVRTRGQVALAQVPTTGGTPTPLNTPPLLSPEITDISPDFSNLLVNAGYEHVDKSALWIVPKAGGLPHRVGNILAKSALWSQDGRTIFYLISGAIFRISSDGSNNHKVVDVPDGSYGLRVSPRPLPEVLRISVFKRDMQTSGIWEVGTDGKGLHPLVKDQQAGSGWPDALYSGEWIPSGRYYLMRSRSHAVSTFWALREGHGFLRANDGRPVSMYSTPLENRSFTPSVDGKRIFFGGAQVRAELVRYDSQRGQFLPFLPGIVGRYISVSKDAKEVAYTTVPDDVLWKSSADGSKQLQLTPANGMRVFTPRWSPDGKWIAFTGSPVGQPSMIYLVPSGGGTAAPVDSAPFEVAPSWSPDGSSLLITHAEMMRDSHKLKIYRYDMRTRTSELLPGTDGLADGEWSPDGRYIAATHERLELNLIDMRTHRRSILARGSGLQPFWSHDSKYVYFQDLSGVKSGQPIYRVAVTGGRVEKITTLSQIPQADVTDHLLVGLTADDAPIARVTHVNSDIYALDLDLP